MIDDGIYEYQIDPYRLLKSFLAISRSICFLDNFKNNLCSKNTRRSFQSKGFITRLKDLHAYERIRMVKTGKIAKMDKIQLSSDHHVIDNCWKKFIFFRVIIIYSE